ncbi:MAG: hypothetical protein HQL32_11755 [Planctomycetes bacterium]|nr:hypothetical protein [Planctomycetota bacterium]
MRPILKHFTFVTLFASFVFTAHASNNKIFLLSKEDLSNTQWEQIKNCDRLLLMIPGVSSGDLAQAKLFLENIRVRSNHTLACFYDWEKNDITRKIASPSSTKAAANRLFNFCNKMHNQETKIDIIAHSAGTIVTNKTAQIIFEHKSAVRFNHVLLLGTALDSKESLAELRGVSSKILNIHSTNDKVNRNINDADGVLEALQTNDFQNMDMSYSLSGRTIRHYEFLSSHPENWVIYSRFLSNGKQIQTTHNSSLESDLASIHSFVQSKPKRTADSLNFIAQLINDDKHEKCFYGVVLCGILKVREHLERLKELLKRDTPLYLRKEIYQAIGNFELGQEVPFLKNARKNDAECAEVLRDILRSLKRKRVR